MTNSIDAITIPLDRFGGSVPHPRWVRSSKPGRPAAPSQRKRTGSIDGHNVTFPLARDVRSIDDLHGYSRRAEYIAQRSDETVDVLTKLLTLIGLVFAIFGALASRSASQAALGLGSLILLLYVLAAWIAISARVLSNSGWRALARSYDEQADRLQAAARRGPSHRVGRSAAAPHRRASRLS